MSTYTLIAGEYVIEVRRENLTDEEASTIAATFAASAKMKPGRVYVTDTNHYTSRVSASVSIVPNQANGGVNEAGIKRLKSIFRTIDKAGDTIELQTNNPHHTVASVQEFRDRYNV